MKINLITMLILIGSFGYGQLGVASKIGKVRVGGGLGVNFGSNDYVAIQVTPTIGYEVINNLEVGVGVGYSHISNRDFKRNFANLGTYAQYNLASTFFARANYEYYTGELTDKVFDTSKDFDENALWLGGGYTQQLGGIRMYGGVMYNVLFDEDNSIFVNAFQPIVGVSIGL